MKLFDETIKKVEFLSVSKTLILRFLKLEVVLFFSIHDLVSVNLLTTLRLDFSHLNETKF